MATNQNDACQEDDLQLTSGETLTLRILYGVVLTGEIANLFTCIYITFAYLVKKQVKSHLIIIFYVIAYLVIIGYSTSLIAWLVDPQEMFYCYKAKPETNVSTIAKISADCAIDALGFVVLVTMYQITLSI